MSRAGRAWWDGQTPSRRAEATPSWAGSTADPAGSPPWRHARSAWSAPPPFSPTGDHQIRLKGHCCGTVTIFLRFRLLTNYGSGSGYGSVSRQQKAQFSKKILKKILFFNILSFFTKNFDEFHQIYCKMWMKNLNKENQTLYWVNFYDYILLRFRNCN